MAVGAVITSITIRGKDTLGRISGGFTGTAFQPATGRFRDTFYNNRIDYGSVTEVVNEALERATNQSINNIIQISPGIYNDSQFKGSIDTWISSHPNVTVMVGDVNQTLAQGEKLRQQAADAEAARQAQLKAQMLTSPTAQFAPKTITVQISKQGSGKVLSSGGDNALAERTSITVPYGYKVYLQAVPQSGVNFVKFQGSGGETTQNPFEVPVKTDGSITAVFSDAPGQGNSILDILGKGISSAEQTVLGATHNILSTAQKDASAAVQTVENAAGIKPNPNDSGSNSNLKTVQVQISKQGSGKVLSSGGDNALAERTSIIVPSGYKAYFQAIPDTGVKFVKFTNGSQETTQNPFEVPVTTDGSITAVFSDAGTMNEQELITVLVIVVLVIMIFIGILAIKKRG